jgi:ABC-type branched-subunit amino acid transport system ATPase component
VNLALDVADRVFVLANGEVVHESWADDLDPDDPAIREHVAV